MTIITPDIVAQHQREWDEIQVAKKRAAQRAQDASDGPLSRIVAEHYAANPGFIDQVNATALRGVPSISTKFEVQTVSKPFDKFR